MSTMTTIEQCPECHSFEFRVSVYTRPPHEEALCMVCGYGWDDDHGKVARPHYLIQYRCRNGDSGDDIGELPLDPEQAETWLKAREAEGFEITHAVIVNAHGHVIWLRGDPGQWKWNDN